MESLAPFFWKLIPDAFILGLINAKVELYLKVNKLPYVIKLGDIRKAPKKKFPVIKDEG